jgi:hypothetical protein
LAKRTASAPSDVDDYCNPQKILKLPFLFPEERPMTRFEFDDDGCFAYYGRQKFQELYDVATNMAYEQRRLYFLHGPHGVGESHLLAALACALTKLGRHVVYLPDCRGLLRSPLGYLRAALQLTFANAEDYRIHLDNSRTIDQLREFCHDVAPNCRLFCIIDQANALDHQLGQDQDKNDNKEKRDVRNLLDDISSKHLKFASSSANYMGGERDRSRQTHEGRMTMYEGLSKVC